MHEEGRYDLFYAYRSSVIRAILPSWRKTEKKESHRIARLCQHFILLAAALQYGTVRRHARYVRTGSVDSGVFYRLYSVSLWPQIGPPKEEETSRFVRSFVRSYHVSCHRRVQRRQRPHRCVCRRQTSSPICSAPRDSCSCTTTRQDERLCRR